MKRNTKFLLTACLTSALLAGTADAAIITGSLGLLNPTGAATNGNLTRQYSSSFVGTGDALGATINLTFTLEFSAGSGANLSTAFDDGGVIFRKPANTNVNSGESFDITIDSIGITSGWTIESGGKTDSVTVASTLGRTTTFSVNGGTPFDFTPPGTIDTNQAHRTFTNSAFTDFDSAGDTLSSLNVSQTASGGQNLRNVAFNFVVVPEPATIVILGSAVALVGLRVARRRKA